MYVYIAILFPILVCKMNETFKTVVYDVTVTLSPICLIALLTVDVCRALIQHELINGVIRLLARRSEHL